MQKQKAIVIDCDEIMLDHLGGLREYVKKKYGITTPTEYPTEYGLEKWLNMNQVQVQEVLKQFNERSYEFGLLKPINGAPALLNALRHANPDAHFVVLTKSGTGGHGEVLRKVNIQNVFPDIFDEIRIIEMYESKRGELAKLQVKYDVVCLVDDYIENIETAISLGIHGIMLSRPHNQEYSSRNDFYFTGNWAGIIHNIIIHMHKGE
jgi:FMN phosphatase YigB (HAD superfamily)